MGEKETLPHPRYRDETINRYLTDYQAIYIGFDAEGDLDYVECSRAYPGWYADFSVEFEHVRTDRTADLWCP